MRSLQPKTTPKRSFYSTICTALWGSNSSRRPERVGQVVTGDLRPSDPAIDTNAPGDFRRGEALMNAISIWASSYGGEWFGIASRNRSRTRGVKQRYDAPGCMGAGVGNAGGESPQFPASPIMAPSSRSIRETSNLVRSRTTTRRQPRHQSVLVIDGQRRHVTAQNRSPAVTMRNRLK